MFIDDMQAGKAGEYLVCADLISKGYVAYLSEQGLPYDVVLDTGEKLLKIQVKANSVIACLNMGFEIVGCELDADYFKAGVERVRNSHKQQKLFEPMQVQGAA